jgi:hypothetical protein
LRDALDPDPRVFVGWVVAIAVAVMLISAFAVAAPPGM